MEFLKIKYLLWLMVWKKTEFSDINVNKLLDIQHKQLSSRVERWAHEGSGGTVNSIIQK